MPSKTKKKSAILDRDAQVLRDIAVPVEIKDIGTKKINSVIEKMRQALHAEEDGVAIAAPQIGVGLQIFMIADTALAMAKGDKVKEEEKFRDLIFINPEIIKASKTKKSMEEGCLSVRWLYGQVMRHDKITVRAYDESGKLVTMGASGLIAQIFQHEIDHLNGILFIDKAENIRNLPPEAND